MQLRNILLYGSVFIPGYVTGRSIFDWGQDVIAEPDELVPHIIGISTETTLTRPAEIATMEVWVKAAATTDDEALKEATLAADVVESTLKTFSNELESPIESWKFFDAYIQQDSYDNYDADIEFNEFDILHDFELDGMGARPAATSSKKAKARFSIRISDISAVERIKKVIATSNRAVVRSETGQAISSTNVRVAYMKWELTEASTKAFKRELRAKATNEALDEGQDYAEIFGKDRIRPVECVEEWTWVGEKYDWRNDDDYDPTFRVSQPKEIEGTTTMKCKFSID